MLFKSYEFLLVFLPAVIVGYFALARLSAWAANAFLAASSVAFYAWWKIDFVWILAASIAILCLMLHGLVDYPLRTFAHLTLLGMLAGLLCRPRDVRAPVDEAPGKPEGSYIGAPTPIRSRA